MSTKIKIPRSLVYFLKHTKLLRVTYCTFGSKNHNLYRSLEPKLTSVLKEEFSTCPTRFNHHLIRKYFPSYQKRGTAFSCPIQSISKNYVGQYTLSSSLLDPLSFFTIYLKVDDRSDLPNRLLDWQLNKLLKRNYDLHLDGILEYLPEPWMSFNNKENEIYLKLFKVANSLITDE